VSWLDLGWLRKREAWEFHPWGPFARGYVVSQDQAQQLRGRTRLVRAVALAGVLPGFGLKLALTSWWPALIVFFLCVALEVVGLWLLLRRFQRSMEPLGWESGLVYLAQWFGPKLLTVARILVMGLVALSLFVVWNLPTAWASYLLLGFFVGVQYLLVYLEQVQRNDRGSP